ncbi:glycosyl hydrolase family 95 catalytic domain-containing protein [Niallia circulans]|uniref:glycoside hydrolase family 95 protein n=1 Tax=Niallia circulans TaxID=1397 RepID=UPI001F2F675B|nr:glycoside hydrolase family 95 protein [Niallia circulans]MCF2650709.1 glycoside hydrolase family 95 protein [Niallia circulans]
MFIAGYNRSYLVCLLEDSIFIFINEWRIYFDFEVNEVNQSKKRLWYEQPANDWNEALPIGNGRIGGMVFGHIEREQIQLNEDSVWYGGPRDRNNPDALTQFPTIREHLENGEIREAEKLAALACTGIPESQRHYEPLGDLRIDFHHEDDVFANYKRELDLDRGVATIKYMCKDIAYNRDIFTSYPDQVMVIRLTASKEKEIAFQLFLDRGKTRNIDDMKAVEPDYLIMDGKTGGENGIHFHTGVKVLVEKGVITSIGNRIIVQEASAVTIILAAATSYRYEQPASQCVKTVLAAEKKSYEQLWETHLQDYQSLFHRMDLNLGKDNRKQDIPTNKRLDLLKEGEEDLDLSSTYFHFGRYLLISCSRPDSLPATLQGIWNDQMLPPWDSKYTININTQMNYWPAEVCNLSECHQPLFDHLEKMREQGRKTAQIMYGCRGFTAHHNTDIWGDTAPQDMFIPASIWPLGAAWLSLHLWEHFEYTVDSTFLDKAYELMKDAALFFVDYLVETPEGELITPLSVSPENTYLLPNGEKGSLTEGPSMDIQIIYALFSSCIEASKRLNRDHPFRAELTQLKNKLPALKIGKYGQIQEWLVDYEEAEPGHRHISHLFALHPGKQINPRETPEWAIAAKRTLERRLKYGGGHTGWSRAWIINMWARLEEGELAYENVLELLKSSTLPNLFDNHPPFQIDGNFGGTAGIAEMLIQSHANDIHLLPSIPKAWKSGEVKGLKARGGFEIEMKWDNHQLTFLSIYSSHGADCRIRYNKLRKEEYASYQQEEQIRILHTKEKERYILIEGAEERFESMERV